MSFSSHSTNKANNIYVLVKNFVQGINGKTSNKKFVLPLHCNGDNSYLFVNGGE